MGNAGIHDLRYGAKRYAIECHGECAGTFAYTSAAGTVLGAGSQTLSATFTPNDATSYTTASATVKIAVIYQPGGMCDRDVGHMILQPINANGTSVWRLGTIALSGRGGTE